MAILFSLLSFQATGLYPFPLYYLHDRKLLTTLFRLFLIKAQINGRCICIKRFIIR